MEYKNIAITLTILNKTESRKFYSIISMKNDKLYSVELGLFILELSFKIC